jgi:hypothetical protein
MLRRTTARFAARSAPRRAGGADDGTKWAIPSKDYLKYSFQPSIPDAHYFGAHYNYAPITMWLRQKRPGMEYVIGAVYKTITGTGSAIAKPVMVISEAQMPGIGCKLAGFFGLCLGLQYWVYQANEHNAARMTLEKLHSYGMSTQLAAEGFWNSQSEDLNGRAQDFNVDRLRLEALWDDALAEATQSNSFAVLCDALGKDVHASPPSQPITWRFNMMPYGQGSGDTQTVPIADTEVPSGPFTIMELGSYGDYIDRTDNKPNPIRKARHLYSGAYMPPTK